MKTKQEAFCRYFAFTGIAFLIVSCHVLYIPTSHNIPLLSNKGEGQITLASTTGGFGGLTAFGITDNIGVMANGFYLPGEEEVVINNDTTKYNYNIWLAELGLGYYKQLADRGVFEIYAGGGIGKVPNDFENTIFTGEKVQMNKFFIQPSIGLKSKVVYSGAAIRLSMVNMNKQSDFLIEPGVVFRLGYQKIKFYSNLGLSFKANRDKPITWDHIPFMIGIGLEFNFGKDTD